MRWQYFITPVTEHEFSVFGSGGAGWLLMYGPFDLRSVYDRDDLERWEQSLAEWGYEKVPAPTLSEFRKLVRA